MQSLTPTHRKVDARGWRSALIVIAICSLTLSLATRFWTPSRSHTRIVKSVDHRSLDPKRQHLNKDAARWVSPAACFIVIAPASVEASLAPAVPLLPKHVFSDSLHNRPPPSFAFFV